MSVKNVLITKATKIPVNWTLLKSYLRDNYSQNNQEIEKLTKSATSTIEHYTGKAMVKQTRKLVLTGDDIRDEVELEFPPIISIVNVVGTMSGGSQEVVDSTMYYQVENYLYFNAPLYYDILEIEYECGYSDVRDIPDDLQTAVMRMTANLYSIKTDLPDKPLNKFEGTKEILNEHKIVYLG